MNSWKTGGESGKTRWFNLLILVDKRGLSCI